jgi:hypothetical protein
VIAVIAIVIVSQWVRVVCADKVWYMWYDKLQ